ncbi:MAG: hypothetical protein SGI77_22540 [Pirellulaceae bacterium]|nr:hypothetical protein [Pirellulaceae bacterium]
MVPPKNASPSSRDTNSRLEGNYVQRASSRFSDDQNPLSSEMAIVESSLNDLSQFLQLTVSNHVSSGDCMRNCVTLKQLIEIYAIHLERIRRLRADWQKTVSQVVAFEIRYLDNDEFLQLDAKALEELELWRTEILFSDDLANPVDESVITAQLASQPFETVRDTVQKHVAESINLTVVTILSQLVKLVEMEVLSIIQWFSKDICTFKRYSRDISIRVRSRLDETQKMWIEEGRWKKKVQRTSAGTTSRTLSCYIQHLVNANSYNIGESKVLIPRRQKTLLESMPTWLTPAIRIVEGTLIRETLVEQDVGTHEWEIAHDAVLWHNDPAIVLGPFVLSGWGPREIQEELAIKASRLS